MHLIDLAETNDSVLCVNYNTAINIKAASYLCYSVAYTYSLILRQSINSFWHGLASQYGSASRSKWLLWKLNISCHATTDRYLPVGFHEEWT